MGSEMCIRDRATTDSVVSNVLATLVAFCNALLVTLAGSRIPASTIFTYSPCNASNPVPGSDSRTLFTITEPSSPALCEIVNNGASSALRIIEAPVFSSPSKLSTNSATFLEAWIYAEPPPAIIPSSTAALVALKHLPF